MQQSPEMTIDGIEDSPVPDWQQQEPSRLQQMPVAAVFGQVKHEDLEVKQESNLAPSPSIQQSIASPGNHQSISVSSIPPLRLDRPHDHSPFNSSIQPTSASLPDNSRSFNSTSTTSSTETLDTSHRSRPGPLALPQQAQIIIRTQPPTPGIDGLTTMFTTLQTASIGQKRSREVDDDETQQLQSYNTERRTARIRDNSSNATFAASNISENRISSTSFLSHERSSPPRARSNALSVSQSQSDITMTPYPSDGEELGFSSNHNHGFAKIPSLSLRSRKETTVNPFSAAQSPADSFDSSHDQNEDYQDTSMVTENADDDDAMDMDMDDAPTFSPQTSFSFKPPTTTSSTNPLLSPGSSISQATSLLQSGRLPSPATSDDDRSPNTNTPSNQNLANELDNFGQMGMQLEGAQQDSHGMWRVPSGSGSRNGSRNMGHVATGNFGRGGAKPRVTMGFRADCEKCVRRVPGHFMHIL